MKKKFSRMVAMLMAILMSLSLAACSSKPDGEKDGSNTAAKENLVVALPGEPQSLDPYAHSMYYNFMASTLIYNTLIGKDASGNYVAQLATSWDFTDDLTIHVVLRDDVYFHDGSKMTAEDVKFSLETAAASSFSGSLFAWFDAENTQGD